MALCAAYLEEPSRIDVAISALFLLGATEGEAARKLLADEPLARGEDAAALLPRCGQPVSRDTHGGGGTG